ncbi:alpha/beta fold hydrolase [Alteromonas oceanisediminis]|uniref:alpha/beta fold hydrolase n=1 Tax=Alteromonas oceanisediminis TaxID=2836180 RepID=UPI001BD9582F|nr:alpha/beta hydrolase [Alteromonas oceanisediminis]MBT0586312.1 alpha/beta hydrolase [Alteromonas oceanisediminis]
MWIILLFIILLVGVYWAYYARAGAWIYRQGNKFEAKLYGLKQTRMTLGGIEHAVWRSADSAKPMLLLVHGFTANHSVWLRFARFFTRDYYVVIPDLAGHGDTGFDQQTDYSITAQAERLVELIKASGHSRAHVVGNSMGGFIAAYLARFHADVCSSVVLIDPAGVKSPEPSPLMTLLSEGVNPFVMESDDDFERFYGMVMARPPYAPGSVHRAIGRQYQARARQYEKIFADYNQPEAYLDDELKTIDCPSLVIWGAQDQLIDVSSVSVWQEGLDCDTHVWADLGHMPMIEAPERTAYAVRHFIQRHR